MLSGSQQLTTKYLLENNTAMVHKPCSYSVGNTDMVEINFKASRSKIEHLLFHTDCMKLTQFLLACSTSGYMSFPCPSTIQMLNRLVVGTSL